MEIKRTGRVDSTSVRRVSKTGGESTESFSVQATESPRAQSVSSPGPIAALDSILALQSVDDSTGGGRSKGLQHGEALLELLDDVRDGLLAGGIPRTTLNRLANAVGRREENFADPKLQPVLDEIELRARVELAKLEQADRYVA